MDHTLITTINQRIVPEIEAVTVTENGIINLLNKLQPSKTGGPDNTPSRFLRNYGLFLTPDLPSILKLGEIATRLLYRE